MLYMILYFSIYMIFGSSLSQTIFSNFGHSQYISLSLAIIISTMEEILKYYCCRTVINIAQWRSSNFIISFSLFFSVAESVSWYLEIEKFRFAVFSLLIMISVRLFFHYQSTYFFYKSVQVKKYGYCIIPIVAHSIINIVYYYFLENLEINYLLSILLIAFLGLAFGYVLSSLNRHLLPQEF
jgi:hypothetical protein